MACQTASRPSPAPHFPVFLAKKLLSALLLPPLAPLLLVLAGLLLARRRPRPGRGIAFAGLLALWLLATPWVGNALLRATESFPPVAAEALQDVQAIVVLGGGNQPGAPEYGGDTVGLPSLARIRYAARLHRQTGKPILVTGGAPFGGRPEGDTMAEALTREFGVPVRWKETASRDTAENAGLSAPLLAAAGVRRIALVSHAWHLPRAAPLFERAGLQVVPAPTAFTAWPESALLGLLPSAGGLEASYWACHEWLGRLQQRLVK